MDVGHHESGSSLLARLKPRVVLPLPINKLWPQCECAVSDIIEIGGQSCSGKTQMMLSCVVAALMSDSANTVVMFDIQRHVRTQRLVSMLIAAGCKQPADTLKRLYVSTPSSSHQLLIAIEMFIMHSRPVPVLIAIDSLFSLYWTDRMLDSVCGARTDHLYNHLARRLTALARGKHVTIICTCRQVRVRGAGGAGTEWTDVVNKRIIMASSQTAGVFCARVADEDRSREKYIRIDDSGLHWL